MIISSENCKVEFFDQPEYVTNQSDKIKHILNLFLDFFDILKLDLEISFCSEYQIRELNKKFRGKDSATNVLSFPDIAFQGIRKDCIGEIIVSIDVIKKEVLSTNKSEIDHLIHLIIHSMLHLLGYKHDVENDAILSVHGQS